MLSMVDIHNGKWFWDLALSASISFRRVTNH
jgi:hypothetical protein